VSYVVIYLFLLLQVVTGLLRRADEVHDITLRSDMILDIVLIPTPYP